MTSIPLKATSLLLIATVVVSSAGCLSELVDLDAGIESAEKAQPGAASRRAGVPSDSQGQATLPAINGSGISARIEFVDDGATLTVTGTASGLDPAESYVTLIYDNGSVPGGPNACQPTVFDPNDPDFLLGTMLIGFWEIDPDGNGTLSATNTNFGADYVPLDRFRSTSVRRIVGPPPAPGAPPLTELVACGHVATQPRP